MGSIPGNSAQTNFFLKHCSLSIILFNTAATLAISIAYYYSIPVLLNHPTKFQYMVHKYLMDYNIQFVIVIPVLLCITSLGFWFVLRGTDEWSSLIGKNDADSRGKLHRIRERCMNAPYLIFLLQIVFVFTPVTLFVIMKTLMHKETVINFAKVMVAIYSLSVLLAVITFIFSKNLFTRILLEAYDNQDVQGKRISLKSKIVTLLFPLFIAVVLFTFMILYASVVRQRGFFVSNEYNHQLNEKFSGFVNDGDKEKIFKALYDINVEYLKICDFIITPGGKVITSDGSDLSYMFKNYQKELSGYYNGRIYSEYAEVNGSCIRLKGPGGYWFAGVKYYIVSKQIIVGIFVIFSMMIGTGALTAVYFVKAISVDLSISVKYLHKLVDEGKSYSGQKIPVTSNDEVGDLIVAFNRIREKDSEYDKLKTQFVANISHELRTPLSVLLGSIQLLDTGIAGKSGLEAEKTHKHLMIMKQNCHRLLRLVNNFLDSTRIDSGYFQVHLKNCNVVSVVEEIVLSIVEYTREQGVELYFDTEVEEKEMALDTDIIERIMLNLLSNAIKYSGKGSVICTRIYDRGDRVLISVKDNGVGIPVEKQEMIFERFTQVEGLFTRKHEGSGIGLSLVKSFAELLGGTVTLSSEPEKGSEFIIDLPVKKVTEENIDAEDQVIKGNRMNKVDIEFSDIK